MVLFWGRFPGMVDPELVKDHPLVLAEALSDEFLASLSPEKRKEAERLLIELDAMIEANPLYKLRWENEKQVEFFYADTPIQAAFCGNRFGSWFSCYF